MNKTDLKLLEKETFISSINVQNLPIFSVSKNHNKQSTEIIYKNTRKEKSSVSLSTNKTLTESHRRLFLILEYKLSELLQKNPDTMMTKIRTSYKELSKEYYKSERDQYNVGHIYQMLMDLYDTSINADFKQKIKDDTGQDLFSIESHFRLLSGLNFLDYHREEKIKDGNQKRHYTNLIEVSVSNEIIQNYRLGYYRIKNYQLLKSFQKNGSLRVYDFLLSRGFYKSGKSYKQKKKLRFSYDDIASFLRLKKEIYFSKQLNQLKKNFEELKDKKIIAEWIFEKGQDIRILLEPNISKLPQKKKKEPVKISHKKQPELNFSESDYQEEYKQYQVEELNTIWDNLSTRKQLKIRLMIEKKITQADKDKGFEFMRTEQFKQEYLLSKYSKQIKSFDDWKSSYS